MATVAVFLALGGGAYAAAKITGRDVVNRSLTGKDIKKRSVPLNRLKGRPRAGRPGAQGPPGPRGEQGPTGPVDPSRFLSAGGSTTLAVGPTEWVTTEAGTPLERTAVEGNRVEWRSPVASGAQFLLLEPTLPIELADRPVRLVAATLCYSTLQPDVRLTAVFMAHNRGPLTGVGSSSLVGTQFDDPTIRDESACRRFDLPQPFLLLPGDYVNLRLRFDFDAVAVVHIGASSFELAPA
jgi:hypothetical protein